MKILHVVKKYPNAIGGDAIVVSNLEKQQKLSGNEVLILTTNCKEIQDNKNLHKFGLPDNPSSLDQITIKRLLSLMRLFFISFGYLSKKRPDIIHTHSIDMAFSISPAASWYKIPVVHTFHALTFNDTQQSLLKRKSELLFLRGTNPKKIFVLNPDDIKEFEKKGFGNVQFVPNGINIEDWSQQEKIKKNKIFTFIAVGRLEEQKGFNYLIEAAKALKEKENIFQINIVGEGSQHELLNALIKKNNLEKNIFLLGGRSQKELSTLYAESQAFVLPSLWEEFPLTILEAWASKLPIIISKVGAIEAICKDRVNALLVKSKDSAELAKKMEELINNKTLLRTLSKNGFDEAIKKFQWEKISEIIMKAYAE